MSYIPKYILKHMIPADAVKAIPTGVQITAINVISPTTITEIPPEGVLDKVEFLIDGKPIADEDKARVQLSLADKTVVVSDLKALEGATLPVGGTIVFVLPVKLQPGESHQFELRVHSNRPQNIAFERIVQ